MFRSGNFIKRLAVNSIPVSRNSRSLGNAGQLRRTLGFRSFSEATSKPRTSNLAGYFVGAALVVAAGLLADNQGLISLRPTSAFSTSKSKQYASHEEVQMAISELRESFPEKGYVSTEPDALKTFGSSTNSYHPASPHSVVVQVRSTEDVVKVVNIARKYRIPIVAYSGATSLEGHYSGVSLHIAIRIGLVST